VSQPQTRPSWLPDLLANMALASGVGYLAAAYTVSRWLTRATSGQSLHTPTDHGLLWEPLTCRTNDGLRLSGWLMTPPRPRATVVLHHGLHGNREQTLSRAAFLTRAGYRCVAFDHRAHGASDGKRTSFGYHEARDVAAVSALVQANWPRQPRAVLGMSMGAAAVCFAAEHLAYDAIILESMYHDLAGAFASRLASGYPPWFRRLSHGIVWVTERRLGVRMCQVAPAEHIARLAPAPVLVLTGSEDAHATPAEAERLHGRCRGPRELWLAPNARHEDVFETGGKAYQLRILEFLDRWLARATDVFAA
jgi:alpha-beta hydrolase superfamily lysophospholipase